MLQKRFGGCSETAVYAVSGKKSKKIKKPVLFGWLTAKTKKRVAFCCQQSALNPNAAMDKLGEKPKKPTFFGDNQPIKLEKMN